MKREFLLVSSLIAFTALGFLHFIAEKFFFYWTIFWFDILMHFFGGISVGLLALWLISRSNFLVHRGTGNLVKFFLILLATLGISFVWEVLEHLTGTAKAIEGYFLDTTIDTSAALLGAALVSGFVLRQTSGGSSKDF